MNILLYYSPHFYHPGVASSRFTYGLRLFLRSDVGHLEKISTEFKVSSSHFVTIEQLSLATCYRLISTSPFYVALLWVQLRFESYDLGRREQYNLCWTRYVSLA